MVHVAVASLIGADGKDHVQNGGPLLEPPVHLGDLWGLLLMPLRNFRCLQVLSQVGVRLHSLLFEVTHSRVACLGEEDVQEHVRIEHDALPKKHHSTEKGARLAHLEERQQVHALVLRLLQQGVDPAVVALHPAQAVHVAEHAGHHPGHTGHGLQKDGSRHPLVRCHLVRPIAGGKIEGRAHGLDGTVCHILVDLLRRLVPRCDTLHILLRVHRVHEEIRLLVCRSLGGAARVRGRSVWLAGVRFADGQVEVRDGLASGAGGVEVAVGGPADAGRGHHIAPVAPSTMQAGTSVECRGRGRGERIRG
mmetsp:Transcript_34096/g.88482  ORF Transcript_34096/g.88482 Transcript_34096/m.88482 type:complete len:306 (-) Transcript_34096:283-1200(-)